MARISPGIEKRAMDEFFSWQPYVYGPKGPITPQMAASAWAGLVRARKPREALGRYMTSEQWVESPYIRTFIKALERP